MRNIAIVLAALIISVFVSGCQADTFTQNIDESVNNAVDNVVNDIKEKASEEVKKALAFEVSEFFGSDDLSQTLGISSDETKKLEESVKCYISNYTKDEEKLNEAKKSVEELIENAKGLSADQLQDKIAQIFNE